jgi:OOP family OmpA-OmpF porin
MRNLFYIFSLLFLFSLSSFSQVKRYYNPLSGAYGISLEGGFTISNTDFANSNSGYLTRVSLEYYFHSSTRHSFALKLVAAGFGSIAGDNGNSFVTDSIKNFKTNFFILGGGPEYSINFGAFNPYFLAGAYYLRFNPKDRQGNKLKRNAAGEYNLNGILYTGELGLKYLITNELSFNISAAAYLSNADNLDDFSKGSNDKFYSITAGITFYLQPTRDSDKDGVEDSEDMCPSTPPGVKVDIFGCPVDSDKDGVPDYLDKCPNTPKGVKVDKNGCPVDSDNDGVPDYIDDCPGTPVIAKVDKNGCPVDSDNDGIPDYLDKCPDTPPGVKVDSSGCEINDTPGPVNKVILNGSTNFEFGSSVLTDNAKKILSGLAGVMKKYPKTHWRIEGYTDNVGSEKANKKVSIDRATSVFIYLLSQGLDKNRFDIYGMGSENPIGDNNIEFGRSLNRRVEIVNENYAPGKKQKSKEVILKNVSYNYPKDRIADNTIFTDGKFFTIQISSWEDKEKAEIEAGKLRKQGYNVLIFPSKPLNSKIWYRVRIGYFSTLQDAKNYISDHFGKK